MTTEIASLSEITAAQAQKEVTHNTALRQLEGRIWRVIDRDVGTTPASPTNGDTYIVDQTGGAWSTATVDDIAHFFGGAWNFYTPFEGLRLWVNDEDITVIYDSANWIPMEKKKRRILKMANELTLATTSGATALQLEQTTNANNVETLVFTDAGDLFASFSHIFPPEWDGGTVTFKYIWTTAGVDTDGVAFALQAVATGDGEVLDAAFGTAVILVDNIQSAADDTLISAESTAVTIAGTPIPGELINFRLFRDVSDGGDTAVEDARLISLEVFYNVG